ncbi:hypothetical protein EDD85DRAFT_778436 [Armillaria nabsnona]|nr:hypothetical protein EDD85DRAFT_778436 [Armillaria nabsnona]
MTYFQYPEVTISAFTETGQDESSIIVPLQRAYTGRKPVISSCLADTPCATFSIQGFLDQLNTTLGTTYSLDDPSLSSFLEACITSRYDFGLIYGLLRVIWYTNDWSTVQDELSRGERRDREVRQEAFFGNRILNPLFRPRRVWDLYSNRVVPSWSMDPCFNDSWLQPISHTWMDEKDRAVVWTPINGYEWPISMAKDADLNLVRIEMLNLGLEYAWLDVLCLRQVGGRREDMRIEEWKLDVPTIGGVYQDVEVVCYLSGLGRPLTVKEGDLESDRSWFRRAWTLQEIGNKRVIAGDTPNGPLHAKCKDGKYETELLTRFHRQLESTRQMTRFHKQLQFTRNMAFDVCELLEEMRTRVSTNPVDKIAGLAFLMGSATIPAYYESESLEHAWTALVNSMSASCRGALFLCAEPGNAGKKWRPSWDQVMTKPLPAFLDHCFDIHWDEKEDEDSCDAECIEGLVLGLAVAEEGDRRGLLIVKGEGRTEHRFEITATHMPPIPEDTYTMIYTCQIRGSRDYGWMVGRSLPGGKFEKVSMLIISREEDWRLENLDIIKRRRYILI